MKLNTTQSVKAKEILQNVEQEKQTYTGEATSADEQQS